MRFGEFADAGRVVIVVTHSLTYLKVCDQVVLLAPGGKSAPSADRPPGVEDPRWAPPTGQHLQRCRRESRCSA